MNAGATDGARRVSARDILLVGAAGVLLAVAVAVVAWVRRRGGPAEMAVVGGGAVAAPVAPIEAIEPDVVVVLDSPTDKRTAAAARDYARDLLGDQFPAVEERVLELWQGAPSWPAFTAEVGALHERLVVRVLPVPNVPAYVGRPVLIVEPPDVAREPQGVGLRRFVPTPELDPERPAASGLPARDEFAVAFERALPGGGVVESSRPTPDDFAASPEETPEVIAAL